MANRTHHSVDASKSDIKLVYASAVGAGAADMTGKDDDMLTAVRVSAGLHTLTFRYKYPKKAHHTVKTLGSTVGLEGKLTAWDPAAGTATLQLAVGGVATDAAVGETVSICMHVRNTRAND
jgi:hypothetical protein